MLALKVAVAVAIIKNKPDGLTIQGHTENLQRKFCLSQSQLEDDYEKAKQKILQLEQQIAVSHVEKKQSRDLTDDIQNRDHPKVLTPPMSSNDSQNQMILTLQSTENGSHFNHSTVPFEIESSRFIQSVVSLQNVNSSSIGFKREHLKNSAIKNVHNLSEVLSHGVVVLSESCLCQAAEAIGRLLHQDPWLEGCDEVMEGVCRLVETVLSKLRETQNHKSFPGHRWKYSLIQMLVAFVRTSPAHLSFLILDSLIESWEDVCHGLRNSRKSKIPLDPLAFNNSFFILRTIELILKSCVDQQSSLDSASLHSIQDRLDRSLLHLTDYFPLVAQAVWKVTAIVEKILQGC